FLVLRKKDGLNERVRSFSVLSFSSHFILSIKTPKAAWGFSYYTSNRLTRWLRSSASLANSSEDAATSCMAEFVCSVDADVSSEPAADSSAVAAISSMELLMDCVLLKISLRFSEI